MSNNHIGKTLWMKSIAPAANTSAGFEALTGTWTQITGANTLPVFGVSHNNIDVPDLATGFTSGVKGAGSGRDTQFAFRGIPLDAGQVAAIAAANDAQGIVSLKIVDGSGTDSGAGPAPVTGDAVEYAHGYLHSYEPNQGSDSTHEGGSINFKQNAPTVAATEPA
ncbi:MAG: hypothetical protein ACPGSI_13175 [Pikeienuella sp.]